MKEFDIRGTTVFIETVADLSIQELEELEEQHQITNVGIKGDYSCRYESEPYSLSEYKQIYAKLEEITQGIDDEWSVTKKFIYIFRRVSMGIDYDYIAGYPEEGNLEQEIYSDENHYACRNLKNGLLEGKCVCAGYAEILRHACLFKGVNARYVCGYVPGRTAEGNEMHAWNVVQVDDGTWIEVDPTWSHDKGVEYIGDDREKLWKKHESPNYNYHCELTQREYSSLSDTVESRLIAKKMSIPVISNLDLDGFINSELGLPKQYRYSKDLQSQLISFLERRDIGKEDIPSEKIAAELKENIASVQPFEFQQKFLEEFEEDVGYTIAELEGLGLRYSKIIEIAEDKLDNETGDRIDRKAVIERELSTIGPGERELRPKIYSLANGIIRDDAIDELVELISRHRLSTDEAMQLIESKKNGDEQQFIQLQATLSEKAKYRSDICATNYSKIDEMYDRLGDSSFVEIYDAMIEYIDEYYESGKYQEEKTATNSEPAIIPEMLKEVYSDISVKSSDVNMATNDIKQAKIEQDRSQQDETIEHD